MTIKEVTLPKLGESITNATVLHWFKKVGDLVKEDEILLEVATDKVNSEIPSPFTGVITEILVTEEQLIDVGTILCKLEIQESQLEKSKQAQSQTSSGVQTQDGQSNSSFLSPSVTRKLNELNIPLNEVSKIKGSGEGGRVTKEDVEKYAQSKAGSFDAKTSAQGQKMSIFRQAVAENVTQSWTKIPQAHLTQLMDVTKLFEAVQAKKQAFFEKEKVKLTPTLLIAFALVETIKEFDLINSSYQNHQVIKNNHINLGMAANTKEGVQVPVIKSTQDDTFLSLAKKMHEMKEKVVNNQLDNRDVSQGTVTLTNFGMSGVMIGTPLVRYPEVSIIGTGAIHDHVFAKENQVKIGKAMYLTLTFDHRVFDGMYGCQFLVELQKKVENASKYIE